MAKKREENLTPSAVLETDIIRGLLGATDESVLFSIPDLRTRLNTPAQSFAGVVTFDDNVIVDGVTALNDALGVAGVATFADDLIIADGKSIGQSAGPLLTFDNTNNFLEITGCDLGIGTVTPGQQLHNYKTSGGIQTLTQSDSLSHTSSADASSSGKKSGGAARTGLVGVLYNNLSDSDEAAGYLKLSASNGTNYFLWVDDGGLFRIGTSITQIGRAIGTVVGTQS